MNGKVVKNENIAIAAIPRSDGDLVFIAKPVLNFARFNTLCPQPEAPVIRYSDGRREPDYKDKAYVQAIADYAEKRTGWLMLESLKDTPGLEWDTVDLEDPNTWKNHVKELEDSGFTPREINEIHGAVMRANNLDDSQLEAARNRFLASQEAQDKE
ncbi:MAG: hypothetical protein KGI50_06475 [Patescibacteria group bacterium]|nr:hypothetical protein [Patescibacteria group bacterium]